jgi:hypothetical protein
MNTLLLFYGFFLISCGIASVIFIGPKAKTALISGGSSGLISICIGYFYSFDCWPIVIAGIALSLMLFIVFAWRSTKTFLKLIELIAAKDPETNTKAIAFLIISLMAVVSILVLMLQLIHIPCMH